MPSTSLPPLFITIGDPTGIGPEITVKWLTQQTLFTQRPLHILGCLEALTQAANHLGLALPQHPAITYHSSVNPRNPLPGETVVEALRMAVKGIAHYQQQHPQSLLKPGLVTGPLQKTHLWQAGYAHPGHTELLSELASECGLPITVPPDMLFVYQQLRVLLLTRHTPLGQVLPSLTVEGIAQSLINAVSALHAQGILNPTVTVWGVNPHAGEVGGTEERLLLKPAIALAAQVVQAHWVGPVAADGSVRGLNAQCPPADLYVAAYHDQGLMPIKLLGGWHTVNVTLGLPFWRMSVSHGTANDIVGKDLASSDSLTAAAQLCHEWTHVVHPTWQTLPAWKTTQTNHSALLS
ncbi:MAG: 4-hydroxythreonine-4-phosphate dehydrogenase PdxA [Vampirovibrionales bacterium]